MKRYIIIFIFSITIIFLLIFLPIIERPQTRQEARCVIGLKLYKSYLDFQNFYKSEGCLYGFFCRKRSNLVNYEILADNMHIFNNECKRHSDSEDTIIDQNLKKVKELFSDSQSLGIENKK